MFLSVFKKHKESDVITRAMASGEEGALHHLAVGLSLLGVQVKAVLME
jgi:hypothetical protein